MFHSIEAAATFPDNFLFLPEAYRLLDLEIVKYSKKIRDY